jgi:hypothetical protein
MPRLSICHPFLLVMAVLPCAAPSVCWAADPPAASQPAAGDEVASLLKKIRTAHDAVFSGEFLAAEVIEEETVEGVQRRVSNEVRGVFDRDHGRTRRRHEFRRTRKTRGPLDRCLVVETDAATVLWEDSRPIVLLRDRHALLLAEQCPIDPLALGFNPPISSTASTGPTQMWLLFAEFEKWLAAHQAKGRVSVRREPTGYILSIEVPVLMANGEPLPPELVSKSGPGVTVKILWRVAIDASLGFVPTRTTASFLNKDGNDVPRPATMEVTWAKRGEVAVPVAVHTYLDMKNIAEERRTITFTWKSVNQPISNDEFDYTKFPVPAGTEIVDHRERPGRVIGVIGK